MKMIRVFTLVVVMSVGLACGSSRASDDPKKDSDTDVQAATDGEADDDTANSDSEVSIKTVTLAREAGEKFEPVANFSTSDTYCALVALSAPKNGTRVKCVWTVIAAGAVKNQEIFEKEVILNPETLKGVKDPSTINFSVSHDSPYPIGDYKAEVYLNGKLAQTVKFKVQ